ncbi:hypothetical protein MTR67_043894 [Solanum verrucosum]|uniref:Peptidase A1 domain-containing protein n=1 Tax=Solanum verrucosum TaxID=315347 RepID=A0AAF0ZVJ8_SOLVR|nr:hypothetical protein MTR67_043894 [Solanum verrucosum]
MKPASFTATFTILCIIFTLVDYDVVSCLRFSDVPDTSHRTAMVLPLFPPKDTSVRSSPSQLSGRLLQKSPVNAQMALHDDLLINGYYTTRLWIGTPPQRFALIVDTGSTVTYVPCSTCEQCGKHQDPRFQPEMSSTYQPVKCNIDCTCDNEREQCIYERQYAEMSSSSGVLGQDIVSFGNQSELAPQRAVFGCENRETGDLYSQHADGIMGLGRGDLSIVDQLVEKHVISDSFSLCYGGMDFGGGAMVLGGIKPPADMVFTNSDPGRSPYYNIELKEIHVAGKALSLNPRVFDGNHGTVLDSGTTYAYLPEAAFAAFKSAVMKAVLSLKLIEGPDPNYKDICFSGAGRGIKCHVYFSDISRLSKSFPPVDMVFSNGKKLSLSPENYLFRNGKDATTLLGGIIVRNTLVMYDRQHEMVGFWKTNCSNLWDRLNLSPPPPLPSGLDNTNSTGSMYPTLVPTGSPGYKASGEIKVGFITFYMSLSMNYLDLKPHMTELTHLIAQELDINFSQLAMMVVTIVTVKVDGVVVTIIMVVLGSGVGGCNVADSGGGGGDGCGGDRRMTGWSRSYLIVVIALSVVLILGLSAFLGWLIWRRGKESPLPYERVESVETVVREQELQPLK